MKRRATAAAVRRRREVQCRADLLVGGALLEVVFDGDWRGLAHWLAPRLTARERQRLSEPLPEADRGRGRRLQWVLARAGHAARETSAAHTTALVNAVRACLRNPRERSTLDALLNALDATPGAVHTNTI